MMLRIAPEKQTYFEEEELFYIDRGVQHFKAQTTYILNFLNAFLLGESSGLEYLTRAPENNGYGPDFISNFKIEKRSPVPTELDIVRIIKISGLEKAKEVFSLAKEKNPENVYLDPDILTDWGTRELLYYREAEPGLDVLRFVTFFKPASARASFNLGRELERFGMLELAKVAFDETLEKIETDPDLDSATKEKLQKQTQTRLEKLP